MKVEGTEVPSLALAVLTVHHLKMQRRSFKSSSHALFSRPFLTLQNFSSIYLLINSQWLQLPVW